MAGKLPKSKRIKRSAFRTDEEFIQALRTAGKDKQAEYARLGPRLVE